MAFCTRAAVPGSTFSELLMVRETVAVETFALLATSRMFMQAREKNPRRALYFSKRLLTRETMKCNVHAYMPAIRCHPLAGTGDLQLLTLFRCRPHCRDDPGAFPDGQYLVCLHLRESFEFACRWPLHLDEINRLKFSEAEVQP